VAKSKTPNRALKPEVAEAVRRVVTPAVDEAGLYLEDVKLTSDGGRAVVRVILDLPETETGSLGSDRLDKAAAAVSRALDVDDVVPGAYVLEVSTPGVSRPLTTARHFRRARGRVVEVSRKSGAAVRGRLLEVRGAAAAPCDDIVGNNDGKGGGSDGFDEAQPSDHNDGGETAAQRDDIVLVFDNGTQVPLAEVSKGKVKVELKRLDNADLPDAVAHGG
jgi:ribosome maturation factor RimP